MINACFEMNYILIKFITQLMAVDGSEQQVMSIYVYTIVAEMTRLSAARLTSVTRC